MTRLDASGDVPGFTPGDADASAVALDEPRIGPRSVMLEPREVPLGGLRSMSVRRSLPQRSLPTIGHWCFVDRFGPQVTTMTVDPHPHIGLQTVTWPLSGEIRHRDSLESDVVLKPGALNLMTAGHGIAHSEHSVRPQTVMDALQLWVALPDDVRHGPPAFESHPALPSVELATVDGSRTHATVVMGTLAGVASPATTHSPLVGAQIDLAAGSSTVLPLDPRWEHGVLALDGDVTVADAHGDQLGSPARDAILYLGDGRDEVRLDSERGGRVFLLGGEPMRESLAMWWNFVGRSHEDIVEARRAWEDGDGRFAEVPGGRPRIPAPPLPHVRLTPRTRRL